jgi:tRNA nucleotidyltransferase/poly(A) polymerase
VSTPSSLDPRERFAREVASKLRAAGYAGLFAGGCVRDRLIGRTPKDYDVATDALPEQVREVFGRGRTLAIGAAFGVIAVIGRRDAGEGQVDVATFRTDAQYTDGRRPDAVRYSKTPDEDAQRRDFTINGLYFDPQSNAVIDLVDGQSDLAAGLVRAIGDPEQRFAEDRLRMLRAVRFASTFGFRLEHRTQAAIESQSQKLAIVSPERIGMEMRRLFAESNAQRGLELLWQTRLLETVYPPLAAAWSQTSPLQPVEGVDSGDRSSGSLAMQMLAALRWHRLEPAVAVLVIATAAAVPSDPAGSAIDSYVDRVVDGWKLSNHEHRAIAFAAHQWRALLAADQRAWSEIQPLLMHPDCRCALAVSRAAAEVFSGRTAGLDYCEERLAWPAERLDPLRLLVGDDLLREGIPPGPDYRDLLAGARKLQLDGLLRTRSDAIAWVKQRRRVIDRPDR